MKRKLLSLPALLVAVVAVAGLTGGGLAYLASGAHDTRPTGAFTISSESTSLLVTTYDSAGANPNNVAWCGHPITASASADTWTCAATVKNTKTTTSVNVGLYTESYVNTDTKNLAGTINLSAGYKSGTITATPCTGTTSKIPPNLLSARPGFGADPDTIGGIQPDQTDVNILAGQTITLCLTFTHLANSTVFNASTGASFRVTATDGP